MKSSEFHRHYSVCVCACISVYVCIQVCVCVGYVQALHGPQQPQMAQQVLTLPTGAHRTEAAVSDTSTTA